LEDIAMAMSNRPESSRPRLAEAPPLPKVNPAADARRTRLLTSERLHASIRKVARSRDVPKGEIDDILQETIARAWKAKLPDDDDEVAKYVNRIARNVACERMGKVTSALPYIENPDEEQGEVATPIGVPPPSFETRDVVSQLVEKGEQEFPRGFPGYLEAKATEATAEQVAKRRGVSPGHVRHEWSDIQRFMNRHGRAMGVAMAVALLLLVVGNMTKWHLGPEPLVSHPYPQDEPQLPPPLDAVGLRHRAQDECAASVWRACFDDLDAANKIDPIGETRELRDLRTVAQRHLEAQPPPR
jgi:hypothetical protein